MTQRTRLLILVACGVLFLAFTPYLILYSLGYRVNFTTLKIVPTGGMYVKAVPQGTTIAIDSYRPETTGLLNPDVFLQNLLPGKHTASITKDGYYSYQKSLVVAANKVTKLEHVTLFKKDLPFTPLQSETDYFSLSPKGNSILIATIKPKQINFAVQILSNGTSSTFSVPGTSSQITDITWSPDSSKAILNLQQKYYLLQLSLPTPSATPMTYASGAKSLQFNNQDIKEIFYIKNNNLYSNRQPSILIKNVAAYTPQNNTITWLSYEGILYNYDSNKKVSTAITSTKFPVKKTALYKLAVGDRLTWLLEDQSLFVLKNPDIGTFTLAKAELNDFKLAPDQNQIIYIADHQITYDLLDPQKANPETQTGILFPGGLPEAIKQVYWLNNDYLIIQTTGKIIISEVDIRGNVNMIDIKYLSGNNASQVFYDNQDNKLYILQDKNILVSDKLIP
jgi:hypothetical protein